MRASTTLLILALFVALTMLGTQTTKTSAATLPESLPVVAIFGGHTESSTFKGNHRGCISASGAHEYKYNDAVVHLISELDQAKIYYMAVPARSNIPFQQRPAFAQKSGANVMVEIHHDSVQPHIYKILVSGRPDIRMLKFYRGFSIHVYPSPLNIELARFIENSMIRAGMQFSEYHKENIPGESMKVVDGLKATYERTGLFLLKNSVIPTAIVECGCVANPEDDSLLKDITYQRKMANAIHEGLLDFLKANPTNKTMEQTEGYR